MPSVEFAYNSTTTIPSAGSQRKSYTVGLADDSRVRVNGPRHELIDFSTRRDVVDVTLILRLRLGAGVLKNSVDRDWFRSFFTAKHRWAVYGNFKDTGNSGNDNLCKCNPPDDEVEVSVDFDKNSGYMLESELTF